MCTICNLCCKMADVGDRVSTPDNLGDGGGGLVQFAFELIGSPLNVTLLSICVFLLYKIYAGRRPKRQPKPEQQLPPLKNKNWTLAELSVYDGTGLDGRILIAVNGKVFDVTRGKHFYGPGMINFACTCITGAPLTHTQPADVTALPCPDWNR